MERKKKAELTLTPADGLQKSSVEGQSNQISDYEQQNLQDDS